MARGKVTQWNGSIGRIRDDADGASVFFGDRALRGLQPGDIHLGLEVEFDRLDDNRGPAARNVRRPSAAGDMPPLGGAGQPAIRQPRPFDKPREQSPQRGGAPMDGVPLPRSLQKLLAAVNLGERHPGLQLDKFGIAGKQEQQRQALDLVCRAGQFDALLQDLWQRRGEALKSALAFTAVTTAPLTLHLARAAALENAGICLHPIYGFAYLPGTGLKGMARAYAETVWLPSQLGDDWKKATEAQWEHVLYQLDAVFGFVPYIEPKKEAREQMSPFLRALDDRRKQRHRRRNDSDESTAAIGSIIFHDAWPEQWPQLMVDIVNNHHPKYYQDGEPPGDWENPVPVYFLAVKPGTTFTFPLAKRRIDVEETLLELAQQWLLGALCHAGAGAKTAAGYGCFKPADDKEAAPPCLRTIWTGALAAPQRTACETSVQLRLITPAFLGGSDQNAQNDHLRLTGIKAMLRFWWRAWHGNLTVEQLRDREAQCFGSIDCGTGLQVIPLITQDRLKLLPSGSDMGPGGSPLGYLGYGPISYDKQTKTNRTKVVALNADQHLHFRLVHRSQAELEEVLKSLWLLGALGGIGSRCRRGWGSLTLPSDLNTLGLPSLAACQSVERYRQTLEQGMEVLMASAARPDAGELPWTGLSKQFRVIFSKQTFTSWRDAMEDLGRKFQSFRAYDNRASSPARPKSKPGPDYHQTKHMINSAGSGQGTGSLPERAGFGLPYTQAYRSLQDKRADFTPSWFENGKEIEGRRASPLICKVCQLADGKFFWQVTFLPSQFLPKGAKVNGMAYMKKQFLGQLTNQPYDSPTSFGIIRKNKNLEDTLVYDFLNWLETGRVTYPPSSTPTAPTARSVPPPTPVAIKPINKGQTRTGTLKKEGPSWIARFDGDTREAAITNPGQIPKEAQENSAAEFYIEEASKKVGIRARFEKLIG